MDTPNNNTGGSSTYTVKKGDSLYSIARSNNTTVGTLRSLNNLSSDILSIGQVLKLPTTNNTNNQTNSNNSTYTVEKGDSLYSIARKNNTSVDVLKSLNKLTSNTLSIGQKLLLPSSTTNDNSYLDNTPSTYTVKKGDSLYSIAKKLGTDVDTLKRLNNLTSNLLSIGQILITK